MVQLVEGSLAPRPANWEVNSLLDAQGSAKATFTRQAFASVPTVARFFEHHQQYYIGLAAAKTYRERVRDDSDSSDDDNICDDEAVAEHTTRSTVATRVGNSYSLVPAELYLDDNDDEAAHFDGQHSDQDTHPDALLHLLEHSIASSALPPDQTATFTVSSVSISKARILESLSLAESERARVTEIFSVQDPLPAVTIEAFSTAILASSDGDPRSLTSSIEPLASIGTVSRYFNLNTKQHVAFALIATPLISLLTGLDIPLGLRCVFNKSPIIITGAGGTGKSRIVAAVRAIASAWGCEEAVRVVASTGIAAAALNGSTMHSSVGLGLNPQKVSKHVEKPKDDMLRAWAPTLCVIADEVSMINLTFLGLWEESLGYLKENRDEPYGGLLPVLMFDHCQLGAVKGAPLYRTNCTKYTLSTAEDVGRVLYHDIDKVVYLTDNMRFTEDPEWGTWLSSGRLGSWNPAIRTYIESLPEVDASLAYSGLIETVSADNATRTRINTTAIETAVRLLQPERKVFVVPARLSRPVSLQEFAVIRAFPDNKTGHIPLFLHVYIGTSFHFRLQVIDLNQIVLPGMPVRIKTNQFVSKGVVNGASAIIHHIDSSPDTTHTRQQNGTWLASASPTNIYVNLRNPPSFDRLSLLPACWPSSVMPVLQATATIKVQGPALSIKGFPLVPAFGTTVHGIQGETRQAIAVTDLRPPHFKNVDPHALYVALSRLTTRHGLFWIGNRPAPEDFDYFSPQPDVLLEDLRLKRLSDTTIRNFQRATSSH